MTTENRMKFYESVTHKNALEKRYDTTDHLISSVTIDGVMFLYVSLDNSVRSNKAGHPLYTRLDAICNVVTTIIEKNQEVVVFFARCLVGQVRHIWPYTYSQRFKKHLRRERYFYLSRIGTFYVT